MEHKYVSEAEQRAFPNNCAVLERTADGVVVGRCWFFMSEGVCPRHGHTQTKAQDEARPRDTANGERSENIGNRVRLDSDEARR